MATTTKTTANSFSNEVQTMIDGLTNDTPSSLKSMSVGGTSMTISQVIGALESILTMLTAVTSAKAAYTAAVAAKKAALPAARALYENVVTNLKQVFGSTNGAQLAPFGIATAKAKAKPTSETKAIAHAKSLATRAARGTMGKKQKAAITTTPEPTIQVTSPTGQVLPNAPASAASPSSSTATPTAAPVAPATAPAAPAAPVTHA